MRQRASIRIIGRGYVSLGNSIRACAPLAQFIVFVRALMVEERDDFFEEMDVQLNRPADRLFGGGSLAER
jgi:hypothetical protein